MHRIATALLVLSALSCGPRTAAPETPETSTDPAPAAASDDGPAAPIQSTEVTLCDGKSKAYLAPGHAPTRQDGERIAETLMAQWISDHPDRDWETAERAAHTLRPSADNGALVGSGEDGTYRQISQRDVDTWKRETERVALMGSRVFHSADELGSTVAVSCDMCHPHGANTHPETYPKFQTQLGRVVLLRDMINWCIQHPVRGEPLSAEDPRMRALEAYIYAQRSGVPLSYGKH